MPHEDCHALVHIMKHLRATATTSSASHCAKGYTMVVDARSLSLSMTGLQNLVDVTKLLCNDDTMKLWTNHDPEFPYSPPVVVLAAARFAVSTSDDHGSLPQKLANACQNTLHADFMHETLKLTWASDARNVKHYAQSELHGSFGAVMLPPSITECIAVTTFQWHSMDLATALERTCYGMDQRGTHNMRIVTLHPTPWVPDISHGKAVTHNVVFAAPVTIERIDDPKQQWPTLMLAPQATAGVSNRVNMLAAALWAAHELKLVVHIIWVQSKECPCRFADLFENWFAPQKMPPSLMIPKIMVTESSNPQVLQIPCPPNGVKWTKFAMARVLVGFLQRCLSELCLSRRGLMPQWSSLHQFLHFHVLSKNTLEQERRPL